MRKNGWKSLRSFLVVLSSVLALAACGGGGGGGSDSGENSVTYTGNEKAAFIDATTAEELALGAYGDGEFQYWAGFYLTGASMSPLNLSETLSLSLG